ncbi:MAG: hypothetical protein AAGF07_01455 [Patescibacteria group bacterium]
MTNSNSSWNAFDKVETSNVWKLFDEGQKIELKKFPSFESACLLMKENIGINCPFGVFYLNSVSREDGSGNNFLYEGYTPENTKYLVFFSDNKSEGWYQKID